MRATGLLCVLAGALAAAGCGSSTNGISDARIVEALGAKSVAGSYAIGGNPFCSVSRLLHDSGEVADAEKTDKGHVIAARDGSVGIVIVTPFAPKCVPDAQKSLNKLANKG